jgi:cytoskeletal protein RodZ
MTVRRVITKKSLSSSNLQHHHTLQGSIEKHEERAMTDLCNGNGVGLTMIDEENDEMERLNDNHHPQPTKSESMPRPRRARSVLLLSLIVVFFVASGTHLITRIGGKPSDRDYKQKTVSNVSMETLVADHDKNHALSDSQEQNDTTTLLEKPLPLKTVDQQEQNQQQVLTDSTAQNGDTSAEPEPQEVVVEGNGTMPADNDSNKMTQKAQPQEVLAVKNYTKTDNESIAIMDSRPQPVVAVKKDDTNTWIRIQANDGALYNVTKQTAIQIRNYKRGTGLLLNIHITHHGGTSICSVIGHASDANGITPSFACMKDKDYNTTTSYSFPQSWRRNETSTQIALARQSYHFLSWEYVYAPKIPLSETEWENRNLLSMIVMRDPMTRLLAGDGWVRRVFPNVYAGNASRSEWWDFAKSPRNDNYALRILAGNGCCQGADTNRTHLETAKELIQRVSLVLDIACLSQGMEAVASLLNITLQPSRNSGGHAHASARERIGHDDVYEYLVKKNQLDIELFEWSKQFALVNCSQVA